MGNLQRFAIVAGVSAVLMSAPAVGQTTLAQSSAVDSYVAPTTFTGQSFTAGAAGTNYNAIIFTVSPNGSTPSGNLYLFDAAYTGTPGALSGSTGDSSFVGRSISVVNGSFAFDPTLTLSGGTMYYGYFDTAFTLKASNNDPYSGGGFSYSYADNQAFTPYPTSDIAFQVTGSATAAPEPGSWALLIAGFGMAGVAARASSQAFDAEPASALAPGEAFARSWLGQETKYGRGRDGGPRSKGECGRDQGR